MDLGSKKDDSEAESETETQSENHLQEGVSLFINPWFLIPFLVNQSASILNNFLVAKSDISIVVPTVNCITFIFTFIASKVIKNYRSQVSLTKDLVDLRFIVGTVLICAGLYLCMT